MNLLKAFLSNVGAVILYILGLGLMFIYLSIFLGWGAAPW